VYQNYYKYVEKQSGKKKGKLPKFEHSLQHMKAVGGLKVGLEKMITSKKRYGPRGAKDTFASHEKGRH
jgi:hypothetical protein